MCHKFDRVCKGHIPTDMVTMAMRVNKRRHRVTGQLANLRQNRLSPIWIFCVDNDHTIRRHKHSRIAATTFTPQYKQIVLKLVNFYHLGRILGHNCHKREGAENRQNERAFHSRLSIIGNYLGTCFCTNNPCILRQLHSNVERSLHSIPPG